VRTTGSLWCSVCARSAEAGSLSFGITSDLQLLEADGRGVVLRRYESATLLLTDLAHLVEDEARSLSGARATLGSLVPELLTHATELAAAPGWKDGPS